MNLKFCCDMQMIASEFGVNTNPCNHHTLGQELRHILYKHCLHAKAYLNIIGDHVHPSVATVYPSSNGYFQLDNAPLLQSTSSQAGSTNMTVISVYFGVLHRHQISIQECQFRLKWNGKFSALM